MTRVDKEITVICSTLVAIVGGLILLSFIGSSTRAELWNKCNPHFPVTSLQMWQAGSLFTIDGECSND